MKYRSKKDPRVTASYIRPTDKFRKCILEYDNGEKAGERFEISNATLKRWWDNEYEELNYETSEFRVKIDESKLNEPYKTCPNPKYIPKPLSVIENEVLVARIKRKRMPTYEEMCDDVRVMNLPVKKINSTYIKLKDGTTIHKSKNKIIGYCGLKLSEFLMSEGLPYKENKDYDRPFKFEFKTGPEWLFFLIKVTKC